MELNNLHLNFTITDSQELTQRAPYGNKILFLSKIDGWNVGGFFKGGRTTQTPVRVATTGNAPPFFQIIHGPDLGGSAKGRIPRHRPKKLALNRQKRFSWVGDGQPQSHRLLRNPLLFIDPSNILGKGLDLMCFGLGLLCWGGVGSMRDPLTLQRK